MRAFPRAHAMRGERRSVRGASSNRFALDGSRAQRCASGSLFGVLVGKRLNGQCGPGGHLLSRSETKPSRCGGTYTEPTVERRGATVVAKRAFDLGLCRRRAPAALGVARRAVAH